MTGQLNIAVGKNDRGVAIRVKGEVSMADLPTLLAAVMERICTLADEYAIGAETSVAWKKLEGQLVEAPVEIREAGARPGTPDGLGDP